LHDGGVQASGPRDGVLAALQKQREDALAAANAAQAAKVGTDPSASPPASPEANPASN
jgi:hypothetical protein